MAHWDRTYWDEHPPPPPKRPWLRDSLIASFTGLLLGAAIGFRLGAGYWSYAGVMGVALFVLHGLIMGIGQITEGTRLGRADLLKVAGISGSVLVTSMLIWWIASS